MSMLRRTAVGALAAAAAAAALLAACGGGADRTKAQVRLINASDYVQLDLRVDGELRQGQVSYGNSANYVEVDPDEADTQVTAAGSSTALLSFTPSVSKKKHYAVLAYGSQGALKQVVLDEDTSAPDTNKTLLRVLNAAPDAGALDIYLTGADDLLPSAVAVQAGAAYGTLGSWTTIDSRTWRLRVTGANNKADLRLDVSGLVLSSKQVATLVLTSSRGGVLVNGLLVTQQGSLARADVTHARVRAVAGVADSAAVDVNIGDTVLLNDVASPAVGLSYTLVPAGPPALAVAVNNVALATSPRALEAGADYTLLVHGTPAAPLFNLIVDDNHLPTDSSLARIRLVNGVSGLDNPLTLTVDLSPIGGGIAGGASSAYATVAATTTAELAATSPGAGTLYSENDRTLLAGSTYSVFVLGSKTAPNGVLRKDR